MTRQSVSRVAALGVTLLTVALAASARGESLEDAWSAALGYDPVLRAAGSRVAAAHAELDGARTGRLPTVSTQAAVSRWNETPAFDFAAVGLATQLPLFSGSTLKTSEARVAVPLYSGGTVGHGIDAAEAGVEARQRASGALTQTLKLQVAERYVGVLRAASGLAVADSTVASLTAHVADVNDRYESGDVARNDALAAAVALADAEQRRLQAQSALDLAKFAYNRQLGRPFDGIVELEDALPAVDAALTADDADSLVARAKANRDELFAAQAAVDGLLARSEAARADARPKVFATGGYTFLGNDVLNRNDFWSVGVGFTWNVFDGGRARDAAAAFANEARATSQERESLETGIALEVREAQLSSREARERLRVTERAIEQAAENLRVVRDRYRNGESTNTEVLDAERLRAQSISNHDNARYDAALADLRLARAVGTL